MDIITLIKALVSGLVDAEEDFLKHLDTFSMFEESVRILTNQMAADFIGMTLLEFPQFYPHNLYYC